MVLVEAESFEVKGGWVLDQQFIDQMGSPFLMAHGMGKPVADASTSVIFGEKHMACICPDVELVCPLENRRKTGPFSSVGEWQTVG